MLGARLALGLIAVGVLSLARTASAQEPLPGVVFVVGDIYSKDPDAEGKRSTRYWREGYLYHRATSANPMERTMTPTRPGRNLYTLIPATPDGQLKRITHLTTGQVFDPEPNDAGDRILFSMCRDGELWFHLYEIGVDGTGLRQLTDGPFNDVSGVYLPDGRIAFVSDRAGYLEEYHEERTETLWAMNGDGTGLEQLTFNPGTVFDPTVLADGRICFSLWDTFLLNVPPADKHETYLMAVMPDGTQETFLFGAGQHRYFNRERHSGFALTQPGPLPGGRILAQTELGPSIVEPAQGREVAAALWPVFPTATAIQLGGATHRVHLSPIGSRITPYPLPDGRFLLSATLPGARDLGVYLCDPQSRDLRLVYNDPLTSEYDARPILLPRPRPQNVPSTSASLAGHSSTRAPAARQQATQSSPTLLPVTGVARFVVDQARRSDNPAMQRALQQARYFRVVEALHTAVTSSSHTNLATRILGVIPILPDGSVCFEAPGETPLFLEPLDAAGRRILFDWNYPVTSLPLGTRQPLLEMSYISARSGETKSCHGCHGSVRESPLVSHSLMALAASPARVERDITDVLYRRNEPGEYRCQARFGEALRYRPWLDSPDPDLRRRACTLLMEIEDGARQDAPALARLLKDRSVTVRRAAALALARLGSVDQCAELLGALHDPDWQVRFHASMALEAVTGIAAPTVTTGVAMAPEAFFERLASQLGGPDGLRRAVMSGPEGLPGEDIGPEERRTARWLEAASRLGTQAPQCARRLARSTLAVPIPPPATFQAVAGKRHALQGRPPDLSAIRAAGWMRDADSVPALVAWLARPEYDRHAIEAALALGRIGNERAVDVLWEALRREVPKRRVYLGRYLQRGPRPEEYAMLRGLLLAGAVPKLTDVPFVVALLPGTFFEKPRFEDRMRPESQRVLLCRLLLEKAGLRRAAVQLLVKVLRGDHSGQSDPLYQQLLAGINLERPFAEHGRSFPLVKQIEPEQALWLLGCLVQDPKEVPDGLVAPYLSSPNWRERIDGVVLLARSGFGPATAASLAGQIARGYPFHEIMSIGKGMAETNFRDKCYMVLALAKHVEDVQQLRAFADAKRNYRDVRYGLAVGLGARGKEDGIALLAELATADPISVVRRQARASLRAIQERYRLAGKAVPMVELPPASPFEALYPPRGLNWPAAMTVAHAKPTASSGQSTAALEAAVTQLLDAEHYRNLNNTNNQAPGARRMMVEPIAALARTVPVLCVSYPHQAGSGLHRLLDSPYPFAHYLALQAATRGEWPQLDRALIDKLDVYAKSADTVGFYWACNALAECRTSAAIETLARYAQSQEFAGLHGPVGMGYGYPAAKALARLAGDVSHPEVRRLLASENDWLRAGAIAGLSEVGAPGARLLLQQLQQEHPSALVRAEIDLGLRRLADQGDNR